MYKNLYDEKRVSLNEMRARYEVGLERLKVTQEQVQKFSTQLESNSPILIDKQIEVERVLEKLKDEHESVGRMKEILT